MSEAAPRWERGQAQLCLSGSTGSIQSIHIPTDSERPSGFVPVLDLYQSWICISTSCRVCIPVGTRSQILAFSLGGDPCAGWRGRGSSAFLPTWSNPTLPSLAPGSSGSDFAKFASSVCEFSDKFCWFWFFSPWISREHNRGWGGRGGQERGGAGREGLELGILTWTRLMALVGAAHRAPYVSHIKAGSAACANSTRIPGIMESLGKGRKGEGLRTGVGKWRPPQSVPPAGIPVGAGKGSPGSLLLLE